MTKMSKYGDNLFKGAATYYSKYRPMYPSTLIRYLVNKFDLYGEGRLLDLGCGTGQLTMRFSDWCNEIVGIDVEKEMIEEAIRMHKELRFGNIEWFNTDLENYKNISAKKFQLVTIAKAFHWMDRQKTLEDVYEMVSSGGGVAIIDNYEPDKQLMDWQETFNEVVEKWYGNERRAGKLIYQHPKESHEEMINRSKFDVEIHHLPTYCIEWTIESILGNHYSTSYGAKRFLGENVALFEQDVRNALLTINENGVFHEKMNVSVKLGLKD